MVEKAKKFSASELVKLPTESAKRSVLSVSDQLTPALVIWM